MAQGPQWANVGRCLWASKPFGTPQITCPGESCKSQSNLTLTKYRVKEGEPGNFERMPSAGHGERDRDTAVPECFSGLTEEAELPVPGASGLCKDQSIQGTVLTT